MKEILRDRIKASLYHRFVYPFAAKWRDRHKSVPLRYAPEVKVELKPGDRMHGHIAFLGFYEKELSQTIAQIAREVGGTFVDVGANIGYYSLIWVAQSPATNNAIAIEPSPRVVPLLKKNIQSNGFEREITVLNAAAGDSKGEVKFDVGPRDETGWGGVTGDGNDAVTNMSEGRVSVPQVRLDEVTSDSVSLLKIDVEGAEAWVLQGAKELLESRKVRQICFEHNLARAERLGIERETPFRFLREHGYEVAKRGDDWWSEPVK